MEDMGIQRPSPGKAKRRGAGQLRRPVPRHAGERTMMSRLRRVQFALGLRLGDPGRGGSEAVVSSMEGTNFPAVSRTCCELSDRAISASRRFTETVWVLGARARAA